MIQLGVFFFFNVCFFHTFNHIRIMIDDPSMIQQVDVPLKTHTVLNSQISLDIFRNLQISVRPSAAFLTGGQSLQGCAFGGRTALLARGASRPGAGARYLGLTVQRGSGDNSVSCEWILSCPYWHLNNHVLIRWCASQLQHFVASASQKLSYRPSSSYSSQ